MMEGFRDGPVKVLFRFGSNVKDENLVRFCFSFFKILQLGRLKPK